MAIMRWVCLCLLYALLKHFVAVIQWRVGEGTVWSIRCALEDDTSYLFMLVP
jgi:hypothetical protein